MTRGVRGRRLLATVMLAVAGGTVTFAGDGWRPLARSVSPGIEWMATEGTRIAGRVDGELRIGTLVPRPVWERSLDSGFDAAGGVLAGERLYLVDPTGRLFAYTLSTGSSCASHVGADTDKVVEIPLPGLAARRLARAGDLLVVAENGFGFRVLAIPAHGSPPDSLPSELATLPYAAEFTALTAFGGTVVAATTQDELVVATIDATSAWQPTTVQRGSPVSALALQGHRLAVGGPEGVSVLDLRDLQRDGTVVSDRPVSSLHLAGRGLIGVSPEGIESWRDVSPAAALIQVNVSNNFFSPSAVEIDAGDTVRWSNSFGFHNVFSCIVGQSGCNVAADESFGNGPPTDGPWVYSHVFSRAGSSPYVCQSHAPSMTGLVTVAGGVVPPPEVPDGAFGSPMTVGKNDPSAKGLLIDWDGTTCPGAVEYALLWGSAASWPALPGGTYQLAGSVCDLVTDSFLWDPSPDAAAWPGSLVWWVVVANDDGGTEGSWGRDGLGGERSGTGAGGASGACGSSMKSLDAVCP